VKSESPEPRPVGDGALADWARLDLAAKIAGAGSFFERGRKSGGRSGRSIVCCLLLAGKVFTAVFSERRQ
jgi:hypothetical protein